MPIISRDVNIEVHERTSAQGQESTSARGYEVDLYILYVSYGFCIHECTSYLVTTRDVKPEVTYWSHDLYKPMRAKLVPIKGRVSQNKLRVFMALNPVTSILWEQIRRIGEDQAD